MLELTTTSPDSPEPPRDRSSLPMSAHHHEELSHVFHRLFHICPSRWPDDTPLFDDLSFTVADGRTGLVAPNGAGKSTLLQADRR